MSFFSAAQQVSEGERLYQEYCGSCHNVALPMMPGREALRKFDPRAIMAAMTAFSMRRQAATLSPPERRAIAAFLTDLPADSFRAPLTEINQSAYCESGDSREQTRLSGRDWNGWGAGLKNTRYQAAVAGGLSAADLPRLRLKWAFGVPGVASSGSQATVVNGRVYFGSLSGLVYSLDAETGCIVWTFQAQAGVRSTPVVNLTGNGQQGSVYFGDNSAEIYALDLNSGDLRWQVKVEAHPDAMITGASVLHDGRLYVPVSSLEEAAAVIPSYECCTFRGSLVALDANTGERIWQTYMIPSEPSPTKKSSNGVQNWGPSGAAIWSSPTLDLVRQRIYVGVGDNYTQPATPNSDAIVALDLESGRLVWVNQTIPGDAWNVSCSIAIPAERTNCPQSQGPDHDFGSSPVLSALADGREILLAGQKSGVLHALDPDTGTTLWQKHLSDGGILGGIEWGFAVDAAAAYVSLSSAVEKGPGEAGGIAAVRLDDGHILWQAPPAQNTCAGRAGCNTAQPAAVTAIPGAVFSGSIDGHLRAYDAQTGRVLWDYDTAHEFDTVNGVTARGGAINGPGATVADGMLFVNSGYASFGFMPGNVLLAFSLVP